MRTAVVTYHHADHSAQEQGKEDNHHVQFIRECFNDVFVEGGLESIFEITSDDTGTDEDARKERQLNLSKSKRL